MPLTLTKAILAYFEIPTSGATKEIKPLTDNDKSDFAAMLRDEGYDIAPDVKGRW